MTGKALLRMNFSDGATGPRPGPMARQEVRPAVTWALERAPNPRVIRVHTTVELTRATIEKCPPASPPEGLSSLLAVDGVRSVDLHRYRARLNLSPGCNAKAAWEGVARAIEAAWGAPAPLPGELRHERSRSPTKDPGSWPRVRRWPLPMQPSWLCSGSPGWPRPSSRLAGYGSGRAVCSPGRTWRPRSAGLCSRDSAAGCPYDRTGTSRSPGERRGLVRHTREGIIAPTNP